MDLFLMKLFIHQSFLYFIKEKNHEVLIILLLFTAFVYWM